MDRCTDARGCKGSSGYWKGYSKGKCSVEWSPMLTNIEKEEPRQGKVGRFTTFVQRCLPQPRRFAIGLIHDYTSRAPCSPSSMPTLG